MTGTLGAAALAYAVAGWPVLPLRPGGKVPLTTHGLRDATIDADQVAAWWTRWPTANVGLRTGDAFDVLDLDGPDGEAAWDTWHAALGWSPNINRAVISATGGGGQHWLYRPTGHGNRARLLAHVDWRGRGGYVVAPPSVHPSGVRYEWLTGPDVGELLEAPPALVALLAPDTSPSADRPSGPVVTLDPDRGDGTRYGLAALRDACSTIAGAGAGTRNDTLNREALGVFGLVKGGQLTEALADGWLEDAARSSGLGDHETRATLRSAWSAATPRVVV